MTASLLTSVQPGNAPRGVSLRMAALYVAGYVLLDWVSYIQPVGDFAITPWNPPPGLSLAFLLRFGWRQGPWLLVAGIAAELLVRGVTAPLWVPLLAAATPAVVYTLASTVLARQRSPLDSMRGMATFLVVVLVATLVVAAALVAVYDAAGLMQVPLGSAIAQSWIGDFVGIAVTTPAVLLLAATRGMQPHARALARDALVPLAAIAASFLVVFASHLSEPSRLFYVLFLPLVWVAMRHGLAGAVGAMVAIQLALVTVLVTTGGSLLDFQYLMLALCVTGLLLGTAVSERRRIEAALRDKQHALDRTLRLAAASEVSSALAHELQQPLTALANYVRAVALMNARGESGSPQAQEALQRALAEVERAGTVVRRLRDFFRAGMVALDLCAPSLLAETAAAGARERGQPHDIAVSVDVQANLAPVRVDRVQLDAVLGNLVSNAIDALKEMPGPRRLRIAVDLQGEEIRFRVEDNAGGVPRETADRLFEHFATSKPEGLGLGLPMSRSIVEAHGGRIGHTRRDGITCFHFTLPRA